MQSENRIFRWLPPVLIVVLAAAITAVLIVLPREEADTPRSTDPPSTGGLTCLQFSRYSGAYVEDGSDEAVSDVAAALIHNDSEKFLDLATVTYAVGSKTATFVVKGLPPGGSAWVLEANRMKLEDGDTFELEDCVTSFREDAVRSTEDLSVTAKGNTLSVRNDSGETLQNVCIYYKVAHTDGNYLGGITYVLDFGTMEPGQTAQKQSAHYGENAEIVRYSFQRE